MKKYIFIYTLLSLLMIACGNREAERAAGSISIQRFDRYESRYLTTGDFSALQKMNTDYAMQTRTLIEDVLRLGSVNEPDMNKNFLKFYQDSLLQHIIYDAEEQYAKVDDLNEDLQKAFSNLLREMPETDVPTFYMQITALDQSIVVDGDHIGISIDKYLGKDYPLYKRFYSEEQRATMSREYIVPDCLVFYLISRYSIRDFNSRTQNDIDTHVGIVMWVANKLLGRRAFHDDNVKRIERHMKKHKDTTVRDLLLLNDFSIIK